jgi:hypothetical protein
MFHTLTAGPRLGRAGRLHLHTLYYDPVAPKGTGAVVRVIRRAEAAVMASGGLIRTGSSRHTKIRPRERTSLRIEVIFYQITRH